MFIVSMMTTTSRATTMMMSLTETCPFRYFGQHVNVVFLCAFLANSLAVLFVMLAKDYFQRWLCECPYMCFFRDVMCCFYHTDTIIKSLCVCMCGSRCETFFIVYVLNVVPCTMLLNVITKVLICFQDIFGIVFFIDVCYP